MKKKVVKKKTHHHVSHSEPVQTHPVEARVAFQAQEFAYHAKNELWYIGIGLILLVGLVLTIRAGNYLLSAVVVATALAVFRITREKPGSHQVEITPQGLRWGSTMFGYHQLKAFWASEKTGQLTVYLERPNFAPTIHFPVPDDQAEVTLEVLSLELPFHAHKDEPISDRFARLLRI